MPWKRYQSINQFISMIINSSKQSADEYHKPCSIKRNRAGSAGRFFGLTGPNRQTGSSSNFESEFIEISISLPARSSSALHKCDTSSGYGKAKQEASTLYYLAVISCLSCVSFHIVMTDKTGINCFRSMKRTLFKQTQLI